MRSDIIERFLRLNSEVEEKELQWREDGRLEWSCEHGIGHTVYSPDNYFVHGCDRCCQKIRIPSVWKEDKNGV